jgi:hypothetical protein
MEMRLDFRPAKDEHIRLKRRDTLERDLKHYKTILATLKPAYDTFYEDLPDGRVSIRNEFVTDKFMGVIMRNFVHRIAYVINAAAERISEIETELKQRSYAHKQEHPKRGRPKKKVGPEIIDF